MVRQSEAAVGAKMADGLHEAPEREAGEKPGMSIAPSQSLSLAPLAIAINNNKWTACRTQNARPTLARLDHRPQELPNVQLCNGLSSSSPHLH
jgi:hypothetical protein